MKRKYQDVNFTSEESNETIDLYTQWPFLASENENNNQFCTSNAIASSSSAATSVQDYGQDNLIRSNNVIETLTAGEQKQNHNDDDDDSKGAHFSVNYDEFDRLLDYKAEKSKLSVSNVKHILKNVITNENVVEMVCSSILGKQIDLPYEPKLTRSKTRELRSKKQSLSTVCALPLTDLAPKPTNSGCQVLIDKELSEDTSDEEYMPSDDLQSDDDFDDTKNTSTSFQSQKSTENKNSVIKKQELCVEPVKLASPPKIPNELNVGGTNAAFIDNDHEKRDINVSASNQAPNENCDKETIGYRTRSKLSLQETPLELIEQQFIPPDITCDMYDWNCDNEDWTNFLKEFTQPLDALQHLNESVDDVEADPEYNVLADEEETADEDKEELRVDRAVKVSRKELNDLMKELFEYSEMISSIEKEKKDKERAKRKMKKKQTQLKQKKKGIKAQKSKEPNLIVQFDLNQKLLLEQQLRQHVQLTTQHFLQTYGHPVLHYMSSQIKPILIELDELGKQNTKSFFKIDNLKSSIEVVEKWERMVNEDKDKNIKTFLEKEIEESDKSLERQVLRVCSFPPPLMETICESDAFPYPLLLPPLPFYSYNLPEEFVPSEELLLILGFDQFLPYVQENKKKFKITSAMNYACELISKHMMPVHSMMKLLKHTRSQRNVKNQSMLKEYFLTKKVPSLIHYIIPISGKTLVKDHPKQLLPYVWVDYLRQRKK